MTELASCSRHAEELTSVALLVSVKGTELHLRSQSGALLRVPLADADQMRGFAALATMAGALGEYAAKPG
jgi:hypothetical protein